MNPFGCNVARDFGMIVNDERNAAFLRGTVQFGHQWRDLYRGLSFRAQLNEIDAAANHFVDHLSRITNVDVSEIQNAIEPAAAEIVGSQSGLVTRAIGSKLV